MIGDLICTLPAIAALRAAYPDAELTVIASHTSVPIINGQPGIANVIGVDKKRLFKSLSLLRETVNEMHAQTFDAVFLFHNSIGSAILAWLARIPVRIGYATELRRGLLTHPVPSPHDRLHLAEQRLNLLKRIGIAAQIQPPKLALDMENARATVRRLLPELSDTKPLVGIAVGSTWETKIYPKARIASLLHRLPVGSCSVVLLGSPGEEHLAEGLTSISVSCFNLVGKTTLDELVRVISRCDVLITPDNGPMHIAEALDKHVIAIFGPTDPRISGMLHDKAIHLQAHTVCLGCWEKKCRVKDFCMNLVTEEDVLGALMPILEGLRNPASPA
jgi:lipopolysaccharide heptosyltransferase II